MVNQTISAPYTDAHAKAGLWQRFMAFCKSQENNRLMWLGISLVAHGCVLTPVTVLAVVLSGTNIFLFMLALVAMGVSLVTNLAAMPTKVTIPVFVLSIVIDIAIIISCVLIGFDISKTYI